MLRGSPIFCWRSSGWAMYILVGSDLKDESHTSLGLTHQVQNSDLKSRGYFTSIARRK